MSLKTVVYSAIQFFLTGTADGGSPRFDRDPSPKTIQIESGIGTNQADKAVFDTRQIAASGSENLDLAGGLLDPFGQAVTFAKVKAIEVYAKPTNVNNVEVGGAASNGFLGWFKDATDVLKVPPGGKVLLVAPVGGWAVTAGTGDLLKVANSGSGTVVDYDITVIGTSA